MLRLLLRRRRPGHARDEGFAMLSVLLFLVIVTTITGSLFSVAMNYLPQARHEQSFSAALGAAESGVDDYLDRLNHDYNYATDPPDGNLAFSQCVPVNSGKPSLGCYQYRADTSQLSSTGTITLYSSGTVGKVTRTVKVGLRPFGFLDALSMSNYNIVDPTLVQANGWSAQTTAQECEYHAYQTNTYAGGTGPASGCSSLLNYYVTGTVMNGPVQSNDEFYLCGTPSFQDDVYSGDPNAGDTPYWLDPFKGCGTDAPTFNNPNNGIQGGDTVTLPPASGVLSSDTQLGVAGQGCLYTGPTSITLNSTGTMSVVSPETVQTNPNCLGNNVPLPPNGTIYVQNQPAAGSGDPNAGNCQSGTQPPIVQYSGDNCTYGDAFVSGTLAGQLTIGSANNIFITGNLTYQNINSTSPRQVLGLVANNFVDIFHPVSNGANVTGTVYFDSAHTVGYSVPISNPHVDAAILSTNHSFGVQNFNQGSTSGLGNIYILGTLAGQFMDIDGVFGSGGTLTNGYNAIYSYDQRFRNGGLVPPNFLNPAKTFWHRVSYAECLSPTSCP